MKKITLPDGRTAAFPDSAHPEVIGRTISQLMAQKALQKSTEAEETKKKAESEEKQKRDDQKKRDDTDELRHKEKIAVGLQNVKSGSERNKSLGEHIKATKEIVPTLSKSLEGNASKIVSELSAIRKSLDGLGGTAKQLKELSQCIDGLGSKLEIATKLIIDTLKKPKKLVKSERGVLIGIKHEDD